MSGVVNFSRLDKVGRLLINSLSYHFSKCVPGANPLTTYSFLMGFEWSANPWPHIAKEGHFPVTLAHILLWRKDLEPPKLMLLLHMLSAPWLPRTCIGATQCLGQFRAVWGPEEAQNASS